MRAAAGGEEQPSPPHSGQRARRRLVRCDRMAQLAVRGSAPRVDRVVLREGERVEVPARQPHDTRVPQRTTAFPAAASVENDASLVRVLVLVHY